jgi:hypothetical protein
MFHKYELKLHEARHILVFEKLTVAQLVILLKPKDHTRVHHSSPLDPIPSARENHTYFMCDQSFFEKFVFRRHVKNPFLLAVRH